MRGPAVRNRPVPQHVIADVKLKEVAGYDAYGWILRVDIGSHSRAILGAKRFADGVARCQI